MPSGCESPGARECFESTCKTVSALSALTAALLPADVPKSLPPAGVRIIPAIPRSGRCACPSRSSSRAHDADCGAGGNCPACGPPVARRTPPNSASVTPSAPSVTPSAASVTPCASPPNDGAVTSPSGAAPGAHTAAAKSRFDDVRASFSFGDNPSALARRKCASCGRG
jgi:hypothetical protein